MSSVLADLGRIRDAYRFLTPQQRSESPYKELIERYNLASKLLDPAQYRVYDLYYIHCLSQESVAAIVNCSEKYVWKTCVAIKQAFEYLMDEEPGGGA